jgi:hypothetical protein
MENPNRPEGNSRQADDERAQPGDVIGIERDGERTHLGETSEDENERREEAEDADED